LARLALSQISKWYFPPGVTSNHDSGPLTVATVPWPAAVRSAAGRSVGLSVVSRVSRFDHGETSPDAMAPFGMRFDDDAASRALTVEPIRSASTSGVTDVWTAADHADALPDRSTARRRTQCGVLYGRPLMCAMPPARRIWPRTVVGRLVVPTATSTRAKSTGMPEPPTSDSPSHSTWTTPSRADTVGADGTGGGVTSDATVSVTAADHSPR